ncbi:ATP-binding protein [Leisingera sp. M658]|uniref:sensor histidine kinase n=1 Tax=Leisingera sp. M658 TaxID=2867015 RepID=UPI0021A73BFA|nr:HAMP domain-containing sensor histidine kinase [Leisingera sp. M658]UWQ73992.1 HAMP domain-containing histidine kinase [Leisingera sp. M658]
MTVLNILVIDDDAGDRKLARRLLQHLYPDANVIEADCGEAALSHSGLPVEVILLDYLLPDGTGLDLIARLTETWPRAVLFMTTGQGDEEIAKSVILAGASDYIPKSAITSEALMRMIKNGQKVADMRWRIQEQQNELRLFSDVLVHDMRAPIRAIKFLSDQIHEDYQNGDLEEVARQFELMKKSVRKTSELIEGLASHINPHSNGKPAHVTVESLFDSLRAVMAQDLVQSGVRIRWHSGGLAGLCFPPDIVQLLQNLIGNAIKYSGGKTAEVSVTAERAGSGLMISVADNGIGVPAQYREKIFEPFKRLQRGSDQPGSGLGLATCAKIAKRHNGTIWCDPEADAGTTIRFTIDLEAGLARETA